VWRPFPYHDIPSPQTSLSPGAMRGTGCSQTVCYCITRQLQWNPSLLFHHSYHQDFICDCFIPTAKQ